ncbi:hypothetical protein CAPTEDRAFT_166551 [Capitella teleta]|uniref:Pyrroline-5-carboxylate reductase n=1 Tax=Capitella teleta TaxID=283909 RepID=R7VCY3_CAPTE|nr:hypothetical protein CAPTEDRAFT_166551 [Capitella teleta]|eukprot:ELU16504.1 hypothetical protein CAPTEDRAFT_166551 [Capitella teleta]
MASTDNVRVGFLGAGQMAQALCSGIISSGLVKPNNVIASDPKPATLQITSKLGARTTTNNAEVMQNCDVVVISVKPNAVPGVLKEILPLVTKNHLVTSIAAGISLALLEESLPPNTRVIRVMPNTPAMVQAGATVISPGTHSTPEDAVLAEKIFSAVGICKNLPEKYLDVVSSLSGAGPAYAFLAIEALSDGGVKMGLPRDISTQLAAQTLLGAAKMVLETNTHPGQLKDAVCSPGGVTICGVHALESGRFRASLIDAVETATLRTREMENQMSKK